MRRIRALNNFYLTIYLNKRNLLILSLAIIALIIVAYYSLGLGFDESEFVFIKEDYIQSYLEATTGFVMILNCVIIPTLFLSELKEEANTINYILIPRVTRESLNLGKLITILKIALYYNLLEGLIIGITPIIWYPSFCFKLTYLKIVLFITLYSCISVVLVNLMMKLLKVFVVGAIPLVIYLVLNFLKDNEMLKKYGPILIINKQDLMYNIPLYTMIGILLIVSILYLLKK